MSEQDQDHGSQDKAHREAIVKHGKDVALEVGMEMVKEGLQEALEVGAGPVAGIVKAGSAIWSVFNVRKFAKYLGDLSFELDCNDPNALRQLIQEHGDKSWVTEGLDYGFRKIMDSIDAIARKCILVMVADYMKRKANLDRHYQQIGSLLKECDEALLRPLKAIAEALPNLKAPSAVLAKVKVGKWDLKNQIWVPEGADRYDLIGPDETFVQVSTPIDDNLLRTIAELLARHRFFSGDRGLGLNHPDKEKAQREFEIGVVFAHHRSIWTQLRSYLAPVGASGPE